MKICLRALLLAMLGMLPTVALSHLPAEPGDDVQILQAVQAVQAQAKDPCPTEIEVQPYIWIEPTTGIEYRVLHLHCPDEEES